MRIKITAKNIVWDTDGEEVKLPKSASYEIEVSAKDLAHNPMICSIDNLEATMSDWLSDTYGWCVKNYELSFVEVPSVTHAAAMKFLKAEAKEILEKAIAKHKKFKADIEKHNFYTDPTKFRAIQANWMKWIVKNVGSKGFEISFNQKTGEPLNISATALC